MDASLRKKKQEKKSGEPRGEFAKHKSKLIAKKILNRLLDLRNVTFFRQHFSVGLVPYNSEVSKGDEMGFKTPRMEVAENCLLNIEQVIFKTLSTFSKTTNRDQTVVFTGTSSNHFYESTPRLLASVLSYVKAPKICNKLATQLAFLFKIGTYCYNGNIRQSLFGIRLNVCLNSKYEYLGHELFTPLLVQHMHYWDISDARVLSHISQYQIFDSIFNAPSDTLHSLFGISFMKRHGTWISNNFNKPEKFVQLVSELHEALNLSTMERAQFLKLASLVVLLLDSERMFIEMEQESLGGVLNPQVHNDRIRKYILSLPNIVIDEICQLFGPDTDKWSLVSKVEQFSTKANLPNRLFSSLAQYVHRALFNWSISKICRSGDVSKEDGIISWNFIWMPHSSHYLTTNVAVEHLHAWAVRYLCESEEVSMRNEGFSTYSCDVWKNKGNACHIVEQFMNGQLDIKSLPKKFTINHSFGSVLYTESYQKEFVAEELVVKLREILPIQVLTSVPHFIHLLFLEKSPLESAEVLEEEIYKSFLKMVCDVDQLSFPHKISLSTFKSDYAPILLYKFRSNNVDTVGDILSYYLPVEEFLVGTNSVLVKESGYQHLEKQMQELQLMAISVIESVYLKWKQRRSILKHLKHLLEKSGRSVNMEHVRAAQRIRNWWKKILDRRHERKWAVQSIENFWIMVLVKRRFKQCVRTIEDWWINVRERRAHRDYWLDIAVRILQKNMRTFIFRRRLAKRIAERKQRNEERMRIRTRNMDEYDELWKDAAQSLLKDDKYERIRDQEQGEKGYRRSTTIRSLKPPEKLLQLMDSPKNTPSKLKEKSTMNLASLLSSRSGKERNYVISQSVLDEFVKSVKKHREQRQLEWYPSKVSSSSSSSIQNAKEIAIQTTPRLYSLENNIPKSMPAPKREAFNITKERVAPTWKSRLLKAQIPRGLRYQEHEAYLSKNPFQKAQLELDKKELETRLLVADLYKDASEPIDETLSQVDRDCLHVPDFTNNASSNLLAISEESDVNYHEAAEIYESEFGIQISSIHDIVAKEPNYLASTSKREKNEEESSSSAYSNLLNKLYNKDKSPVVQMPSRLLAQKKQMSEVKAECGIQPKTMVAETIQKDSRIEMKKSNTSKKFTSSRSSSLFMRVYGQSADTDEILVKHRPYAGKQKPPISVSSTTNSSRSDSPMKRSNVTEPISRMRNPTPSKSTPNPALAKRKPRPKSTPNKRPSSSKKKNHSEIFGVWEKQVDSFVEAYMSTNQL